MASLESDIALLLHERGPLQAALERAAARIAEYFSADGVTVFAHDVAENAIISEAAWGTDLVGERISLRLHEGSVFLCVLRQGTPLALRRNEGSGDEVLDFSTVGSALICPLSAGEPAEGLLVLSWRGSRDEMLSAEQETELLRTSRIIALSMERYRHHEELERSEEKYRAITENASDMVFTTDTAGRFTFLNTATRDVLGYSPESLVGSFFSKVVTPQTWERTKAALKDARRRGETNLSLEWTGVREDGTEVLLDVRLSSLKKNGETAGLIGIARDITEKRRMQQEIARRNAELSYSLRRQSELQDYLALVTRAQEEERKRIARELHDTTVQALVAISRRLDLGAQEIHSNPRSAKERILEATELLDATLEELRRTTRDLRPPMLDDLGLLPALEWLIARFGKEAHVETEVLVDGTPCKLDPDAELTVFRVVQESLNNVLKHANASRVTVSLQYGRRMVTAIVKDDGAGFGGIAEGRARGGLGLLGMQERAYLVGGQLTVKSKPGKGTEIRFTVPKGNKLNGLSAIGMKDTDN
ncbi:MAG: PAS domain S-box protein [Bacillota bacterium]